MARADPLLADLRARRGGDIDAPAKETNAAPGLNQLPRAVPPLIDRSLLHPQVLVHWLMRGHKRFQYRPGRANRFMLAIGAHQPGLFALAGGGTPSGIVESGRAMRFTALRVSGCAPGCA